MLSDNITRQPYACLQLNCCMHASAHYFASAVSATGRLQSLPILANIEVRTLTEYRVDCVIPVCATALLWTAASVIFLFPVLACWSNHAQHYDVTKWIDPQLQQPSGRPRPRQVVDGSCALLRCSATSVCHGRRGRHLLRSPARLTHAFTSPKVLLDLMMTIVSASLNPLHSEAAAATGHFSPGPAASPCCFPLCLPFGYASPADRTNPNDRCTTQKESIYGWLYRT